MRTRRGGLNIAEYAPLDHLNIDMFYDLVPKNSPFTMIPRPGKESDRLDRIGQNLSLPHQ